MTVLRPGARLGLLVLVAGMALGIVAGAQQPADGVYTTQQAASGGTAYDQNCASCHGADLSGSSFAPELAGATFMAVWGEQTTRDLFDFIRIGMPPGQGGSTTCNACPGLVEAGKASAPVDPHRAVGGRGSACGWIFCP